MSGPVVIAVLDGIGCGRGDTGDAVFLAQTPNLDRLRAIAPTARLCAHGPAVGLREDEPGNSEVGHNTMGAGRPVDQSAVRVERAITSGQLFATTGWKRLIDRAKAGGTFHLIGLLSDGGVHSDIDHLFELLAQCARQDVPSVRVHILLDGRDVPDRTALRYVDALEELLRGLAAGDLARDYRIASGGGRMAITMDRYGTDWDMVARGWRTHVHGDAAPFATSRAAIERARADDPDVSDQYLPPFVVVDERGNPVGPIRDGDSVLLFNFRGDRAVELCRAFEAADLPEFDRGRRPDALFAGITEYDHEAEIPSLYLVAPPVFDHTLGESMVEAGVTILAIAESHKFGHVTYFWNGNRSGRLDDRLETYIEIPSSRLRPDERPWMRAGEVTDVAIDQLRTGRFRHARINYANGDMVGHTGKLAPTILAVEAVDVCIGRLAALIDELEGALIVTGDHGNAEEMISRDGQPSPSHTINPVPFYVHAPGIDLELAPGAESAGLASVSATLLHLLGFDAPELYAPSLVRAEPHSPHRGLHARHGERAAGNGVRT